MNNTSKNRREPMFSREQSRRKSPRASSRRQQPTFVDYVPPPLPVAYQIRDTKVNSLMENQASVLHYTL